jgi:hypothetical protein
LTAADTQSSEPLCSAMLCYAVVPHCSYPTISDLLLSSEFCPNAKFGDCLTLDLALDWTVYYSQQRSKLVAVYSNKFDLAIQPFCLQHLSFDSPLLPPPPFSTDYHRLHTCASFYALCVLLHSQHGAENTYSFCFAGQFHFSTLSCYLC